MPHPSQRDLLLALAFQLLVLQLLLLLVLGLHRAPGDCPQVEIAGAAGRKHSSRSTPTTKAVELVAISLLLTSRRGSAEVREGLIVQGGREGGREGDWEHETLCLIYTDENGWLEKARKI